MHFLNWAGTINVENNRYISGTDDCESLFRINPSDLHQTVICQRAPAYGNKAAGIASNNALILHQHITVCTRFL